MDRRKLLVMCLTMVPAPAVLLLGQGQGEEHGRGRGNRGDHGPDAGRESRYFRPEDYGLVRHYYNGPRDVPPGLRKKYYRTGMLPPGWEKKMRPFPPELARTLPPPPPNCGYGYIDGVAVVYNRATRVILDSIDLISAVTGR
jgi:hypothetical protein